MVKIILFLPFNILELKVIYTLPLQYYLYLTIYFTLPICMYIYICTHIYKHNIYSASKKKKILLPQQHRWNWKILWSEPKTERKTTYMWNLKKKKKKSNSYKAESRMVVARDSGIRVVVRSWSKSTKYQLYGMDKSRD